jgi:hypothetical protein
MRRRVPDASKLRRVIGFAPEIPLESSLQPIINYFRSPRPTRRRTVPATLESGRRPMAWSAGPTT